MLVEVVGIEPRLIEAMGEPVDIQCGHKIETSGNVELQVEL